MYMGFYMVDKDLLHSAIRPAVAALLIASLGLTGAPALGQEPGAGVVVTPDARLSFDQMLKYASETVGELEGHLQKVQRAADDAKKQKDLLLLNCLNEKLTDIRSLLKVAETAKAQLEESIARNERDRAEHEFSKVVIARTRGAELVRESETCSGEGIFSTAEGPTTVLESGPGGDITDMDPDADFDASGDIPTTFPGNPSPTE